MTNSLLNAKINKMLSNVSQKICNKNVHFLWSGGDDSTALLKVLIEEGILSNCNFNVITIPFPHHVYYKERFESCRLFFEKNNLNFTVLEVHGQMEYAMKYSLACGKCKIVRRKEFVKYYNSQKKDNDVIITAHNLSDLMAYYIEMIIDELLPNVISAEQQHLRMLEVANKFFTSYETEIGVEIYRPFINFSQDEINLMLKCKNFDNGAMKIIDKKCFWANQRKRLLQEYFIKSEIVSDFDIVYQLFQNKFSFPTTDEFRELSYDVYLV